MKTYVHLWYLTERVLE